jgi:hypothetical protein
VDWERHETHAEAEKAAKRLVQPHEEYSIEESGDEKCPACEAGPYREKGVSRTA